MINTLHQDYDVIRLAKQLGIPPGPLLVEDIIAYCHRRIKNWIPTPEDLETIEDLEQVVCERLNLTIREVNSDEELDALIEEYVRKGDYSFALLHQQLDNPETYGLSIKHKVRQQGKIQEVFVAVIDCRTAEKRYRRFFTKWHEIAHILTEHHQEELMLYRSETAQDKNAVERLMDRVAAKVGFYDPLFMPILNHELAKDGDLTLATIERIRDRYSSDASFQATMIASIARLPFPALYVEARLALKKDEREQLDSPQLTFLPLDPPEKKLRAVYVIANDRVKDAPDFTIHPNMQVPPTSVIAVAHKDTPLIFGSQDFTGTENLSQWTHSDGSCLSNVPIRIHARCIKGSVYAVVTPFETEWCKSAHNDAASE